jgi:hypothetical protein
LALSFQTEFLALDARELSGRENVFSLNGFPWRLFDAIHARACIGRTFRGLRWRDLQKRAASAFLLARCNASKASRATSCPNKERELC